MSGRTASTFALAGALLLAAAGGAAAQNQVPPGVTPPAPPAGTRVTVPQLGPLGLELDLDLPTKAPNDHRQVFNFAIGLFGSGPRDYPPPPPPPAPCPQGLSGGFGSYCAPHIPRLVEATDVPLPPLPPPPKVIRLVAAEDVLISPPTCPPCPLPKVAPNPLLGTWFREVPGLGLQVVATFTHDELKLCATQSVDGHVAVVTLTAHYTLTPDGLVYGAITSADVTAKSDPKAGDPSFAADLAEMATALQAFVDVPFSCRTKATSAGLMVSGLKLGLPTGRSEGEQIQVAFGGLFKPAKDGKVPPLVAAPVKARATGGKCDCGYDPSTYPIGGPKNAPGERVGIDFSTNPPTTTLPAPPAVCPTVGEFGPPILSRIPYLNRLFKTAELDPPCPVAQPPRPAAPGVSEDGTKLMATEAFGQLLQQSGVVRPASGTGGMTLPSPKYLEHYPQYFPPDPVLPAGATYGTATPAAPVAVKGAVGTWFREVAGKQCVVTVTPDHLTLTVHDAQEFDGKVSTASLVITADYHLTRDGMTAVGLITSVDVSFEGEFPADDSKPFFEMLSDLQKTLEDKPFALTFRAYGDALVIGNVRMPQVSDRMDVQPAGYMAGRYKAAGDKLPKPKPVKVPADRPRVTENRLPVPSGVQLGAPLGLPGSAYPQGGPVLPPPPAGNSDLLPPQSVPDAPARVVPSAASDTWAPPMAKPVPPAPQMPQPVPPPDDAARTQELLTPSETTGAIGGTPRPSLWRRFWNNDLPSHLTPERIHGGIY